MNRRDLFKSLPLLTGAFVSRAEAEPPGSLAHTARFRTAICAYSFRDALKSGAMTYEGLVRLAVELDVDGLDLTVYWFPNTSDEFLLPLRRAAYRMGVELYSISVRTDFCQQSPELRQKEIEELKKWIDVAAKLGAGHVRVFGGDVPKGATEDQAAGWVVECLKRGAEHAANRGVILGLENHGGITSRAERVLQIVKGVDSPWVGINLDTGGYQRDPYREIEMCLPLAVNAQFKTEMERADGTKEPADWARLVGMFAKAGYKGYLALEYEAEEPASTAVPRLIKKLQELTRRSAA